MDTKLECGNMSFSICVIFINPIALRKTKIVCNFGLSECKRVKPRKFDAMDIKCFTILQHPWVFIRSRTLCSKFGGKLVKF